MVLLRGLADPASVSVLLGLMALGTRRRGNDGVFSCETYAHRAGRLAMRMGRSRSPAALMAAWARGRPAS